MTNLPSLADRRLYLELCSLYKIVHNLSYFPPSIIEPKVTRSFTSTPLTSYQPFAHTNCFLNPFVPHSVSHWNSLPEPVVSTPSLATFKHSNNILYALSNFIIMGWTKWPATYLHSILWHFALGMQLPPALQSPIFFHLGCGYARNKQTKKKAC